jgi:hypothetical protein
MSSSEESKQLRVHTYFPKVKDFDRREDGTPIKGSLLGPNRIEARQQIVRERLILGGELKVLQDELRWCYFKEGVNHYENCKSIVDKVVARLQDHTSTVIKASAMGRIRAPMPRCPQQGTDTNNNPLQAQSPAPRE